MAKPLTAKQESYLRAFDASLHSADGGAIGQELLQITLDAMLDEAEPTLRARVEDRLAVRTEDDHRAYTVRWQRARRDATDRRFAERRSGADRRSEPREGQARRARFRRG